MSGPPDQVAHLIEVERAQIAHEIHDGVLPLLFAASASLSALTDTSDEEVTPAIQQRLLQAKLWIDQAMQAGRRLLTEIYPPELQQTGWLPAAIDTVERLLGESARHVDWELDERVNNVSHTVALAAYRIVVEAIRNAVDHGGAEKIVVSGDRDDHRCWVVIEDNGSGFDPSNIPAGHFGVRSMFGRAELAGGSLSMDSKPGGPTVVTFSVATEV